MKVRSLEPSDIPLLTELHKKYYQDLGLPDFTKGLCSFVIENDGPIVYGMVKTFVEITILTDKSKFSREKRDALYKVLDISSYVAKHHGFDELHAFTNDDKYAQALLKRGFIRASRNALIFDI